jgi:SsrA-binding protein
MANAASAARLALRLHLEAMADKPTDSTISTNRRARFNYEILDTFEAGIVLTGSEIKSVRARHANIAEAYVQVRNGEAWLQNANIAQYPAAGPFGQHETTRPRKLLLHKEQIRHIQGLVERQRLTVIPLKIYIKGRVAKVQIGLGRGKTQVDRRETIKKRDADREMSRALRVKS